MQKTVMQNKVMQGTVRVGVLRSRKISFSLESEGNAVREASFLDGKVSCEGRLYDRLVFSPSAAGTEPSPGAGTFALPSFSLYDVTIGIGFHWQRKEKQTFAGVLEIIPSDGELQAVNILGIEDYLTSVISSEMASSSDLELLKAHAVISRSWLMARIERKGGGTEVCGTISDDGEIRRWYGHSDHSGFDVCADDHCQRYQGLSRVVGEDVKKAVRATWGQVLLYDGEVCDTRFSKCCGGRTELFSTCWEDRDFPYLQSFRDDFCGRATPAVLRRFLNSYDAVTFDWYDWTETVSQSVLSEIFYRKSGRDIGLITDIVPLQRGPSGRISRLRICGEKGEAVVGKELEIRRVLSRSHLKSSAFELSRAEDGSFIFTGHGWGHGVGMCQIGAAVMAAEGYAYREILAFYYPGSEITEIF